MLTSPSAGFQAVACVRAAWTALWWDGQQSCCLRVHGTSSGKESHHTNPVSTCMQGKGGNHTIMLSLVLCYNYSSSKFFEDFFKLSLPKQDLVSFEQFHTHFFP